MAEPFTGTCDVVVNNTYDTAGTLTRSRINVLSPTTLKALFTPDGTKWNEMTAMLRTQFEMKACGIRRFGLYDWLMSSNKRGMGKLIMTQRRDRSPSLIQPFIMGRQNSVVNPDFWEVSAGYATTAYTPGVTGNLSTVAGGDWVLSVVSSYSFNLDAAHFLPGEVIYLLNQSGNDSKHGAWKIVESAVNSAGTLIDLLVTSENSFSTTDVDTTPEDGVVLLGINNVNDVESWCQNPANFNPVKHVPFWYQTRRRVRRVDSEYRKVMKDLMMDNAYYAEFQDLPLAERNRQDEMRDQRAFCYAFFYGRPISSNQTLTNWGSLEQITTVSGASVDPGTGGQLIAYRANMVGVYEQLKACTRVQDIQAQTYNIATFLETEMYDIMRARKSQDREVRYIDVYTDETTADEFFVKFIEYAQDKAGDAIRFNQSVEQGISRITDAPDDAPMRAFGFNWKTYKLFKPQGIYVNIITHEFFDDMLNTFTGISQAEPGRMLSVLDLGNGGTIYPAVLASNRRSFRRGGLEQLARIDATFSCVMSNPTTEITATSETTTAVVECPNNSLLIENFSALTFA